MVKDNSDAGISQLDQFNNQIDNWPGNRTDKPLILTFTEGKPVIIPGNGWFLRADFSREGSDLVLVGPEGQHVIIPGYFKTDELPTLTAGNGTTLKGDVVAGLVGPALTPPPPREWGLQP